MKFSIRRALASFAGASMLLALLCQTAVFAQDADEASPLPS
jgi:hypothetical protein